MPEHLSYMAQFTLATGLRESNVLKLEWQQIDMRRSVAWIHPDQAKAEKAIGVPLNDEAISVLRNQIGKHHTYVFTYKGNPVGKAGTAAWRKALKRVDIDNFRWHDLRHTWASWHVQNGTPLHILKELGGWSSYDMVQRYAHLAPEHLAEFAKNSTFEIVAKSVAYNNEVKLKVV
jgi:integrase